jgi:hypothetical protein
MLVGGAAAGAAKHIQRKLALQTARRRNNLPPAFDF